MLAVVEEAAPLGRRGRVRATVAGSEDAFGSGDRLRACVHVQPLGREEAVLLDCGASALTGLGLRLRVAGRVIAYSGDTAWTDTLIELADRADLFVCEAYTSSRRVRYHMDPSTWAEPSIARTSLSSWNWRWRSSRAEDLKRGREFGAWRQNLRVSPYQWPSLPQG